MSNENNRVHTLPKLISKVFHLNKRVEDLLVMTVKTHGN